MWNIFAKLFIKQAAKQAAKKTATRAAKKMALNYGIAKAVRGRSVAVGGPPSVASGGKTAAAVGGAAPAEAKRGVGGFIRDIAAEAAINKASSEAAGAMALLSFKELGTNIPSFFHSITVEVVGGPGADLRRCWYLALAACFGRYRRGLKGISGRTMSAQWDITGKSVSVTMSYTFSGLLENTFNLLTDKFSRSGIEMFHEGPDQLTIGAGWPTFFYTSRQAISSTYGGIRTGIGARLGSFITGNTGITRWPDWMLLDDGQGTAPGTPPPGTAGVVGANPTANYDLPPEYTVDPADSTSAQGVVWSITYAGFFTPSSATYPYVVNGRFDMKTYPPDVFREHPYGNTSAKGFTFAVRTNQPAQYHQWDLVNTGGKRAPRLDDDGRVITTGEKWDPLVQNPRPPVDGLIKGSLLAMIAQSLSSPGYLVGAPPSVGGRAPIGFKGLFVYPSGSTPDQVKNALNGILTRPLDLPPKTPGYGSMQDPNNKPDAVSAVENIR